MARSAQCHIRSRHRLHRLPRRFYPTDPIDPIFQYHWHFHLQAKRLTLGLPFWRQVLRNFIPWLISMPYTMEKISKLQKKKRRRKGSKKRIQLQCRRNLISYVEVALERWEQFRVDIDGIDVEKLIFTKINCSILRRFSCVVTFAQLHMSLRTKHSLY